MSDRVTDLEDRIVALVVEHYGVASCDGMNFPFTELRRLARELELERITAFARFHEDNRRLRAMILRTPGTPRKAPKRQALSS
jgi:hypothetical protein